MILTSEVFPDFTCDVSIDLQTNLHVGEVKYKFYTVEEITGPDVKSIRSRFDALAHLASEGAMLRLGIILTGYHNRQFKGDVLLSDGEFIGTWESDEFEWCFFTKDGATEITLGAPSPWMLQDSIASWLFEKDTSDNR